MARAHDYAGAAQVLGGYLERFPETAAAWRLLGQYQSEGGDAAAALVAYQEAHRLEPHLEDDYVPLIRLARETANVELGQQLSDECFHSFRQNVACRVEHIRSIEAQVSDPVAQSEAIFTVLQALGRNIGANIPRLRQVEYGLRNMLSDQHALTFLQAAAADRPRNTQIQSMTAWAAYRVGNEDLSCEYMGRVLEVNPRSADALNFIGYSYAERGIRLDEAERLVLSALEIRPNDGNIQDSLGWVYFRSGRFEDAVTWLSRAVDSIPDSAVMLDHLADVYRAMGNHTQALELYRRALEFADDELSVTIQSKIAEIEASATSMSH
jgi:tetratricopeptide (TPR) repeat protein